MPSGIQFRLDFIGIFGWGRDLCSASSLGVRKGTMPHTGRTWAVAALGWAALGCTGVGGKGVAVGSGSASGRVSAHSQFSI
jgi:hypothetical protein